MRLMEKEIKEDREFDLTKQLFYALYNKEIKLLESKIDEVEKHIKLYKSTLISSVLDIKFYSEKNRKLLKSLESISKELKEKEEILKLKLEQYKLMSGEEKEVSKLQDSIKDILQKRDKIIKKMISFKFLLFSKALQDKSQTAFKEQKELLSMVDNYKSGIKDDMENLFLDMEKKILGVIQTFEGESIEEIENDMLKVWNIINEPLFFVNKTPISIFKLIISIVIFILGFFISKIYKRYILKITSKSKSITESTKTLLINLGQYFIFIITLFIVLNVLGIDLSSIALVAGALSVGIGFGLQNIISNFVSGIILMLERSIKIGDYIELDSSTKGRVTDIKMRSIILNTGSNIDITVPNQKLVENKVTNWSMNDKIRMFQIPFGVAYGTSPQKVIDIVLEAVEKSNCKSLLNSENRRTKVVMTEMADSSINFELFVWISGKDIFAPKSVTSKFLIAIYNALYENGIEIPFPQQDIHIRSIDKEVKDIIKG